MPIDFLCPNGHRLSGPSRLQGRAGQCPHCGEKFEIPVIDDDANESPLAQDDPIEDFSDNNVDLVDFVEDRPSGKSQPAVRGSEAPTFAGLDDMNQDVNQDANQDEPEMLDDDVAPIENDATPIEDFGEDDFADDVVSFSSGDEGDEFESSSAEIHPLRDLFEMFWEEKQHGAKIQIFLGEEEDPFVPQWYSPALSQASHALFARQDADKKYTLTAIAWDAMERIEVGKLDVLPEDAFE